MRLDVSIIRTDCRLETQRGFAQHGRTAVAAGRAQTMQGVGKIERARHCGESVAQCFELGREQATQRLQRSAIAADAGQADGIIEYGAYVRTVLRFRLDWRLLHARIAPARKMRHQRSSKRIEPDWLGQRIRIARALQFRTQPRIEFGTRCDGGRADATFAQRTQQPGPAAVRHASVEQQQIEWVVCAGIERCGAIRDRSDRATEFTERGREETQAHRIIVGDENSRGDISAVHRRNIAAQHAPAKWVLLLSCTARPRFRAGLRLPF